MTKNWIDYRIDDAIQLADSVYLTSRYSFNTFKDFNLVLWRQSSDYNELDMDFLAPAILSDRLIRFMDKTNYNQKS